MSSSSSEILNIIIRDSKIILNGEVVFQMSKETDISDFLKSAYKNFSLEYPKYFKMDRLSKFGFLASEILFSGKSVSKNTTLIFANSNSSLDTDEDYFESMKTFPSPSLFVYTLPNIMLGEISIRHQLRSENIFFISENFDPALYIEYLAALRSRDKQANALCGWVDLHSNDYDVFLWQIAPHDNLMSYPEQLKKLYLPTNE